MAPAAGVIGQRQRNLYPLRRRNGGQSMQAQASPERERSLTEMAAVVTAKQGVVKRTAVQVPETGEHQPPESYGWCRPYNQTSLRTVYGKGGDRVRVLPTRALAQI